MDRESIDRLLSPYGPLWLYKEKMEPLVGALQVAARSEISLRKGLEAMRERTGYYDNHLPFLRLPQEIRDQIYEYALVAPDGVSLRHPIYPTNFDDPTWLPPSPALCRVNKQIHLETVKILHTKN